MQLYRAAACMGHEEALQKLGFLTRSLHQVRAYAHHCISPEHVAQEAQYLIGSLVTIRGTKRQEMDGTSAFVIGFDASTGCYIVEFLIPTDLMETGRYPDLIRDRREHNSSGDGLGDKLPSSTQVRAECLERYPKGGLHGAVHWTSPYSATFTA